jgi:hypothetical protein
VRESDCETVNRWRAGRKAEKMNTGTRERVRREIKARMTQRLLDQCVSWRSASGAEKFGVVSEANPHNGIAKVESSRYGVNFVRADLLRPFWGAW